MVVGSVDRGAGSTRSARSAEREDERCWCRLVVDAGLVAGVGGCAVVGGRLQTRGPSVGSRSCQPFLRGGAAWSRAV